MALVLSGSSQIVNFLKTNLFSWIPDWFNLTRGSAERNAPSIEITMWILGFIFVSIIGPLTEELYFRGYLLPRLTKLGKWAPLVNVTLFIIYHFWQPQYLVTMIIAMLPLVYIVWWKKNVYLGVGVHCFLNIFGMAMDLLQRLKQG
jgi:membrane protease YdiL (CAAX protease family)